VNQRGFVITFFCSLMFVWPCEAQRAPARFAEVVTLHATSPMMATSASAGTRAFLIEAAGGTAGSLLGFGAVYLLADDCNVEDLSCNLENAFSAIAAGTVGSAIGAYVLGRAADTQPSGIGVTIGSIAGAAAGIGLWHLFTEELNVINDTGPAMVSYALAQGVVTALGSRIVRALQD
jgi:hypothetical protein